MGRASRWLFALALSVLMLAASGSSGAATLVLDGGMEGAIDIVHNRTFSVPREGLSTFSFRFANPAGFKSRTVAQTLSAHHIDYSPRPDEVVSETDSFGNVYTVARWTKLKKSVTVKETYKVGLSIDLKGIKSLAPYPLVESAVPEAERRFLGPTELAQSGERRVRELSRRLVNGAATEQAAVMAVLNWVVDNVRYESPVPAYDALSTLDTGKGNCQNFSHLSIALLRSAGIPARIVGGVSLGKPWRVPLKDGSLSQSMGQGGHAWIEVYYPDIGWVPYDAQQSHLFVSPRHIRQTTGLDSRDVNDSWRASPVLPAYKEEITAEFVKDNIDVRLKTDLPTPVSYVLTGSAPEASEAPQPPRIEPIKPSAILPVGEVEFGNLVFPSFTDIYSRTAEGGVKTFDKETAEYMAEGTAFAQAFRVEKTLKLNTVSLAMHKFGGRLGSLWIDITRDEKGRPGFEGVRSMPLNLDTVKYHPGYKWFDFHFSKNEEENPVLRPGRYWVVLRHSKDAYVSWFYTPGNAVGDPDDARSTEKGFDWTNVMNYDFNYRVRGAYLD